MAWQTPKTNWGQPGQTVPGATDFNRIEGNTQYLKDEIDSHLADNTYQTPTIVGTQIQLIKQSDTTRLFFKLDADLSGGAITISLDEGATSKPLVDIDGVAVTELSKGFVEVVENAVNFTYAPKGSISSLEASQSCLSADTTGNVSTTTPILNVVGSGWVVGITQSNPSSYGYFNLNIDGSLMLPTGKGLRMTVRNPVYLLLRFKEEFTLYATGTNILLSYLLE